MADAVGGGGDTRFIRDRRDGAEGLGRLGIGKGGAACGVDTREVLVLALASLEGSVLGIVRGIVLATNTIINVLAVVGGVGSLGITDFEAEGITAHEAERK